MKFLNWCKAQKPPWIVENPVDHVRRAKNPRGKKHRPRRAYTLDEFKALLGLDNRRRTVYLVAGLSGLRRKEIRLPEKRDFTPRGEQPCWHLRPEITKGRRKDVVPMVPELAEALLPLWEALEKPTSRQFPSWQRSQALDADLARAGIVKRDAEGRSADFNSFRYFFCTQMAKLLPIRKVRHRMRHRNIRETADLYMDLGLNDVGEDLWKAPTIIAAHTVAHAATSDLVTSVSPCPVIG